MLTGLSFPKKNKRLEYKHFATDQRRIINKSFPISFQIRVHPWQIG